MSVQFGKCNFDGRPVDPKDLDEVRPVLAPYGPDGEGYICKGNFGIIYRAFHTTKESRKESQPHLSPSGFVLTWDGRLDNREELITQMIGEVSHQPTDLELVAAAYRRRGTNAFTKLIGDWALSIWHPRDRLLVLAKDFVGTRPLYYTIAEDQITWCSILEPLVLFAGRPLAVEQEYIAGWLGLFPATHLSPYVGIHSVPPSSFVSLAKGMRTVSKYWEFSPAKRIHYRTDAEYEEHFRAAFSLSVQRRLRSDTPVLAELSGGMDSSSIVCLADELLSRALAETTRLYTLSYYDDLEPTWNERPYFMKVEEKRGQPGDHIDITSEPTFEIAPDESHFPSIPAVCSRATLADEKFATCLASHGSRVVLSGIGGDEVVGGVPTPVPEIADLLASCRGAALARALQAWALSQRRPWLHLLFDTIREFIPVLSGGPDVAGPACWLHPDFVKRYRRALRGYTKPLSLFGPPPSFQQNLMALDALRRQLGCSVLTTRPLHETRYPFLDRDMLQFLYAIPREQLLRPGQRRSLLRRAMVTLVPDEVLSRKRKAFVSRGPLATVSSQWPALQDMSREMISSLIGVIDQSAFVGALQKVRLGQAIPIVSLIRSVQFEQWLRSLRSRNLLGLDCLARERNTASKSMPRSVEQIQ